MSTNTYVALDKQVLSGAVSSITFNSIPQTYTDLVLVAQGTVAAGSGDWIALRFNGDTASNYSNTRVYGNGSAAGSIREVNQTSGVVGAMYSGIGGFVCHIQNYSNATTYKTCISRNSSPTSGEASAFSMLWRKAPEAITSITVLIQANTMASGTTFSLYGIAAEPTTPTGVTGGTLYSDATYYYNVFNSSGTLSITSGTLKADILVVAGGAGGGHGERGGGGGGAGGYLTFSNQALAAGSYAVTVGAGGAAGSGDGSGANGNNSQFAALTAAIGGGKGGGTGGAGNGGSGGGQTYNGAGGGAGTGTSGQGNNGGNGYDPGAGGPWVGGGGGGASANGTSGGGSGTPNGGAGSTTAISGGSTTGAGQNVGGTYYFAGGAGGGVQWSSSGSGYGAGGNGGGGRGARVFGSSIQENASNGTANTGGGGGGGTGSSGGNATAGSGGSGIVIVRYAK